MLKDVKKHYDVLAPVYDAKWPAYNQIQVDWIMRNWPKDRRPKSVLDLGCGTGLLLEKISHEHAEVQLYGADASSKMLSVARTRLPRAIFSEGNIENAAFVSKLPQCDIVISCSVLHHLRFPGKHLNFLRNLVRPGGTLFISDFALDSLQMKAAEIFCWRWQKFYKKGFTTQNLTREIEATPTFSVKSGNILKPNWFWRVQIYRIDRSGGTHV